MKNKKILALAIASVLGLTACGDDSTALRIDDTISDSLNRQSSIAFDLISSEKMISTPTYLVMDTSDGTLNIPLEAGANPTDRSNPAVAMGDTDGWSPTQPFDIKLDLPTGVTLTTDLALLHAAVKVAKVTVNNYVMSDPVALTAGEDYTVISTGDSLVVMPLNGSLDHNSDYIYAITDALVDSSGEKLGMSTSYAALKNKQIDQTGGSLETPQKIVLQVEGLMDGYDIADYENIIYSSWFTTSSAGESLYAVKGMTAKVLGAMSLGLPAAAVWQGSANPKGLDLTGLYSLQMSASAAVPISANLSYHQGTVKLPSFLERETTANAWYTTPWQSGMPSLAIISNTLNEKSEQANLLNQMDVVGLSPSDITENPLDFVGKSFTKMDGSPLDSERLITKYSPVPQIKVIEDVKFILITPNGAPVGSVPVVIYQHGITSVKENLLASLPSSLNNILNENYAVLAIDLPLHGDRALAGGTIIADEDNAGVFMNFGYLPVGRDNLRQAVADLIGLRGALNLIPATPGSELDVLDTSKVSFLGHSLGAMTGISLQATIERQMPSGNELFSIDKAAFANPGGGIPYLLLNSEEFGGTVKHGLLKEVSSVYAEHANNCTLASYSDTVCFNAFYGSLDLPAKDKLSIDTTFQSFAVAAQTVLETADPFALARKISDTTPIYLAQVNGDTVIPNNTTQADSSPYSTIGGTEPLMTQLKLKNVYTFTDTTKKAALLLAGEHSSVVVDYTADPVDPDHPNADTDTTNELQNHIANFLAGDGSTIGTVNSTLLDPKLIPSLD
ncbi:hypothetical protein FR932_08230 [Moritella marina ATCC 15381]|uniref:Bacterial virulence factor lipase N-terminal domain-containing protein n=1 Tax=Moritella marina ATCC 15381 TaxID=1202962 RepID=A0A5J6WKM7_MORMI|nr:VolA/Pla-1 family phospholipase [Moritella marina]QFI37838.1 hypothetical protein FR932_08230 [Moritella marina ATCC 15381]